MSIYPTFPKILLFGESVIFGVDFIPRKHISEKDVIIRFENLQSLEPELEDIKFTVKNLTTSNYGHLLKSMERVEILCGM